MSLSRHRVRQPRHARVDTPNGGFTTRLVRYEDVEVSLEIDEKALARHLLLMKMRKSGVTKMADGLVVCRVKSRTPVPAAPCAEHSPHAQPAECQACSDQTRMEQGGGV